MSGAHPWTTISEMELGRGGPGASVGAQTERAIELHSDSEYLIYGMRAFVFRWQRQGWRNRRGTQLQHRELWAELIELNARLHIRWTWIKGHNGHRDQTRADELAYQAARALWCATEGSGIMPAKNSERSRRRNTDGIDCGSKLAV